MNRLDLTSHIKTVALELGFDQVGFSLPKIAEKDELALQQWIDEKRHGDMKYLEDFKARQKAFLEKVGQIKSVIVLGVNYFSATEKKTKPDPMKGLVATYARGRDYHEILNLKHKELIRRLKDTIHQDFSAVSCVDTRPFLERSLAVKAGLGFWGKNTMLLSHQYGPWLFLSEIITNLELEPDETDRGSCGTCTRCQSACPTGALDDAYQLDARKCIAYLTIEHKGVIPKSLRPLMKDWIFGCDDCLTVCPFTAKEKQTHWTELREDAGIGRHINIRDLLALRSNREYEEKFKGTALLRTSRKQLLRNACIVLGNTKAAEAIPLLERAVCDKAKLVRMHAAWALGRHGSARAQEVLQNRRAEETDEDVLRELEEAINA